MNITVTGATGFIGRRLIDRLVSERDQVHVLSRKTNINFGDSSVWISPWDPAVGEPSAESVANADAIVHLAGEPVGQRWTSEAKTRIRESRVNGTRHLIQALSTQSKRPEVLVCASAIGIYGSRGDELLTEESSSGDDFLARVCVEWEKQADLAESLGIRVVKLRFGVVLGPSGGALQKMLPPFKAFVGGKIGSGKQWMSWIHLDDVVGLICHAMRTPMGGAFNATAPKPVTNTEFTRKLAAALQRPALIPVPGFALKLIFGDMSEMLLGSQRVLPRASEAAGYRFQYPELESALKNTLG